MRLLMMLVWLTISMPVVLMYNYWGGSVSIMVVQGVVHRDHLVMVHRLREGGQGQEFLLNTGGLHYCQWRVVLHVFFVFIVFLIIVLILVVCHRGRNSSQARRYSQGLSCRLLTSLLLLFPQGSNSSFCSSPIT